MVTQSRPPLPGASPPHPILLLTRPAEASARFAAQVQDVLGSVITVVTSPLIRPHFVDPPPSQMILLRQARGIVFTSETGVAGFARISADRSLPAFCVGPRTAQAARSAGFTATEHGGDAAHMAPDLIRLRPTPPLIHARGVDTTGDLAGALSAGGLPATGIIVYDQCEQPLSVQAAAVLAGSRPVVVPLFSPRSASLFAVAADGARAPLFLAAISAAAAEPLNGLGAMVLRLAIEPTAEGMVTAVAEMWRDIPSS
ncbi:MAG: uroporphyrinogen-III synthase [Gemmobacter sp.]|nr:uroporphyrinogen-III synthase [Gemmobacter sp.]